MCTNQFSMARRNYNVPAGDGEALEMDFGQSSSLRGPRPPPKVGPRGGSERAMRSNFRKLLRAASILVSS